MGIVELRNKVKSAGKSHFALPRWLINAFRVIEF